MMFDLDTALSDLTESVVLLSNQRGTLPLPAGARLGLIADPDLPAVRAVVDQARATFGEVLVLRSDPAGAGEADKAVVEQVLRLAGRVDVVLLFAGLPVPDDLTGAPRQPADDVRLLQALGEGTEQVVTVLPSGSSDLVGRLGEIAERSAAVLLAPLDQPAGRTALVEVLSGATDPTGRLTVTMPDGPLQRAFPFGFGLSYTTFRLSELFVSTLGSAAGGDLAAEVSVVVTNTGERAGTEVVQVYVQALDVDDGQAASLAGLATVSLAAGGADRVSIRVDGQAFTSWSPSLGRSVLRPGRFQISVGRHSRQQRLKQVISVAAVPGG